MNNNDVHDAEDTTRLVYICSPHTGDPKETALLDKLYCYFAMCEEHTPVAPHLFFPQLFGEDHYHLSGRVDKYDAEKLLTKCDELWLIRYCDMTAEMAEEIRFAFEHGIPIRYKALTLEDVEPDTVEMEQWHVFDKPTPGKEAK